MIKLVMLDLDGTLLDHKKHVSRANKKAIKAVHEMGIPVVICTGRNKRLTKKVTKTLPVPVHYCCVGGVEIFDDKDQPIFQENLDIDEIRTILDMVKSESLLVQVTDNNGYYKFILDDSCKKYDFFSSDVLKGRIMSKLMNLNSVASLEYLKDKRFDQAQEIVLAGEMPLLERLKEEIENKYPLLQARIDMWPNYLFVTKKNLGKGNSARVLAKHFGIHVDEILAMGDDYNDMDMLETVGYGIAMAGAIDGVKAVAYDHTISNKESGVAHALKHYIIEGNQGKISEGK